jgi:micrococcal nuclease
MYEYRGEVVNVVDGDTVDVRIDLGLEIQREIRLRLFGINAAERFTDLGKMATEALRDLFAGNPYVTVRTIKDRTEKYGRYLAILTAEDGKNINDWLVESHLAERQTG